MSQVTMPFDKSEVKQRCILKLKELAISECKRNKALEVQIQLIQQCANNVIEHVASQYIQKYSITADNVSVLFNTLFEQLLKTEYNHEILGETKEKGLKLCQILLKTLA